MGATSYEWASIRSGSAPSCETRTEIIACAKPPARRCGGWLAGWLASRLCQLPSAILIEGMWRDEVARDSTLGGQALRHCAQNKETEAAVFCTTNSQRYPVPQPPRQEAGGFFVPGTLSPCNSWHGPPARIPRCQGQPTLRAALEPSPAAGRIGLLTRRLHAPTSAPQASQEAR